MTDPSTLRRTPVRPRDVDTATLLGELSAELSDEHAEVVARLARERDHLFLLHETLVEVERASSLDARLRVFAGAIRKIGFARVTITLRDAALDPTLVVSAGHPAHGAFAPCGAPVSGDVWRRRLPLLERFRVSQSYHLDGRDEWVARELSELLPCATPGEDDDEDSSRDVLLVPMRARDGRMLATLALDGPSEGGRPSLDHVRTVELFAQQAACVIEQAMLAELAERRAARLHRLQEVGSMLARSLDEREIVRELARQLQRVLPSDGVIIARPDVEAGVTTDLLRLVHGVDRTRPPAPLGTGVIAEVARTGRPVRAADYDSGHSPPVASSGPTDSELTGSVIAVPMLVGIQLVGVIALHSTARGAYSAEDEEVLLTVGAQAATALTNARLYAESERERRQSEALADIARAVGESLRLGEVLHLILRHATALLRSEGACVSLRKDEYLQVVAGVGCGELLAGMHLPVAGSMSGRVVRGTTWIISNDTLHDEGAYPPTQRVADVRKTVIVPLITARGAIGALSVINRSADFTEEDARILQRLADHVAVAIVNARLFEEVAEATREWTVAFDAIAGGMVVLDEAGRVTRCNARAVQLAGVSEARELFGREFSEAVLWEREAVGGEGPVERALAGLSVARGSLRSLARGMVFDVTAAPHPSGGAVVTFDDVTSHYALAERHRRVVETASDAIVITDLERRIAFANPAALELFGVSGDVIGMPASELVPPELQEEIRVREERAMAGQPQRYETTLRRFDGELRAVAVTSAPLREVGQVTGVVASLRDVTEEHRARDAVVESEARYRNLFDTATDAIYTLDPDGVFTSVNAATCECLGVPRDALLGRNISHFLDPDELADVRAHFEEALRGQARRYECHLVRATGERRLLSVTNTPVRHAGEVMAVLGIARDVTVERERAAALARSEARYTRLVESASDAIFTVDGEGRFTSVNKSLELATGRSREELLGTLFTDVLDARDHAMTERVFGETMHGMRQRTELRYISATGAERTASLMTAPVIENGQVTGGLGVVRDVTEEKRLVAQLLQQEKLAAIGQLVSGVAHELNNPLASVMAFSQILVSTGDLPDESRRAAETIHQEGRRAAKIVSNLLTFARQHQPERTAADLNQVLLDTLELRRYALRMQRVELEVTLDPDLPLTWADPFQLQQVLLNLISNAEHAMLATEQERRLALRTACVGGTLLITVADNGVGIAPQDLPRIFNPFYTTKSVGEGTGLGLSISDGIVREHGGRIRVESSPGSGATFVVELPHVDPVQRIGARAAPTPAVVSRNVLVVDGDDTTRGALVAQLIVAGHRAVGVARGADALARTAEQRFDMILLGLALPDLPGDAVFAALRRRDPVQAGRVRFLTGDVRSGAAHAFLAATGRPAIAKPVLPEALAGLLTALLGAPGAY